MTAADMLMFNVPHYSELSVKSLLPQALKIKEIEKYLPYYDDDP